MSTLTKVFVVLTAVLSIALSVLFIAAAAQWDNWKALALDYQTGRDAAVTHAQSVTATMQAALAMKEEALATQGRKHQSALDEIKSLTDQNAELRSGLSKAENQRLAAEAGRTKLQEILDVTTGELKATQKQTTGGILMVVSLSPPLRNRRGVAGHVRRIHRLAALRRQLSREAHAQGLNGSVDVVVWRLVQLDPAHQ